MALTTTTALNTNLTGLQTAASGASAAAALAGLVLVSPLPKNTRGYQPLTANTGPSSSLFSGGLPSLSSLFSSLPPTLVFSYEGENVAIIESDITDHYVEANSPIQDQIALRPEVITVKGYVGELTDILPAPLAIIQGAAQTLLNVDAYNPGLGITDLEQVNQAAFQYANAASIANSAISAWSSVFGGGLTGGGSEIVSGSGVLSENVVIQSNQQQMFQQLYGYWYNRTLFNIQSPWAIFTNMAILSVKAIQDAETAYITDFEVSFKKIRQVQTQTGFLSTLADARAATQSAPPVNNGTSAGAGSTTIGGALP